MGGCLIKEAGAGSVALHAEREWSIDKVMRVIHLVWNLIRGGTEGQCARVAMELARRGDWHRVVVFRREGFFLDSVEEVCGPVEEAGIRRMAELQTLSALRRLARRLREDKVEILHAWDADAAIFGQLAAKWAGVSLITSRRDLGQIYPPHKVWMMMRADRRARVVVANAPAIVDALARRGAEREKFRVIPNILDTAEFDLLKAKPFSNTAALPGGERVVMVARLDPEKDVGTVIEAAALVVKRHPTVSFVIAGDGVERMRLEQMVRLRGISSSVFFLGEITDTPALLSECQIGLLTPSRNEGLSNTILEYMAAGLPVVATDCGGNAELVVTGHGGMVVPIGDAYAVAEAIVDLLRKPMQCRAMGAYNRERVLKENQPNEVGDRFEALYREVLQED